MKTNKLIYVGFAFLHHKGTCAGYHHIADLLPYDKIIDCQSEFEWPQKKHSWIGMKILKVLHRLHYPFNMWVMVYCIYYNLFHSHCTFHFVYGENLYRWMKPFLRKSNRIVCTFHQPYSWFENQLWQKRLRQLNGIILVAGDEIEKFKKAAPQADVKFIPHGIDTNFYDDDGRIRKNQILMVGNWLRNFTFANAIFQNILEEYKSWNVVVVTSKSNFMYFKKHPRISLMSGISNERLLDLYRDSKLLFLPLSAFTANNAVLEAASANCPILIASDNNKNSYLDNEYITVLPLNEEIVLEFLRKEEFARKETRPYVLDNFSWKRIANDTLTYLQSV